MSIWSSLLLVVLAWLHGCCVGTLSAQSLPAGTVFITRNLDERDNQTPGFWNHCALYVGDGWIVEAQDGYGVIYTNYADFVRRPYQFAWYYPPSIEFGKRTSLVARTFVGRPYRRASSLAPLLVPPIIPTLRYGTPDGMNCTSVVRDAAEAVIGQPLIGLRVPDDIGRFPQIVSNRYPQ